MFTRNFDNHIVQGDSIECEVDGFTAIATAHFDEEATPLDAFEDDSPYVQAWKRDEWHYFGIAVTVWRDGVQLTDDYAHALWGIDCNVEGFDNGYCRDVANDHLPGALADAKAKIAKWAKEVA